MSIIERVKLAYWNLKHQTGRFGFCGEGCKGFDCTAHCCPKRCWIYKDQRVCPDEYMFNSCPFDFKDRSLG